MPHTTRECGETHCGGSCDRSDCCGAPNILNDGYDACLDNKVHASLHSTFIYVENNPGVLPPAYVLETTDADGGIKITPSAVALPLPVAPAAWYMQVLLHDIGFVANGAELSDTISFSSLTNANWVGGALPATKVNYLNRWYRIVAVPAGADTAYYLTIVDSGFVKTNFMVQGLYVYTQGIDDGEKQLMLVTSASCNPQFWELQPTGYKTIRFYLNVRISCKARRCHNDCGSRYGDHCNRVECRHPISCVSLAPQQAKQFRENPEDPGQHERIRASAMEKMRQTVRQNDRDMDHFMKKASSLSATTHKFEARLWQHDERSTELLTRSGRPVPRRPESYRSGGPPQRRSQRRREEDSFDPFGMVLSVLAD